jgi:hypothetical protein
MPRTYLACKSPERQAIDRAIVTGEPLRSIAKRASISAAGLRHKSHVCHAITRAQERREEKLENSVFRWNKVVAGQGFGAARQGSKDRATAAAQC